MVIIAFAPASLSRSSKVISVRLWAVFANNLRQLTVYYLLVAVILYCHPLRVLGLECVAGGGDRDEGPYPGTHYRALVTMAVMPGMRWGWGWRVASMCTMPFFSTTGLMADMLASWASEG